MHTTTHTPTARPGSRRLVMTFTVAVAALATAVAYDGMVGFGRDMLSWNLLTALAFAGIFELAQFGVALLAREAMTANRPARTLLALTWALAGASGVLAAWHELDAGHGPAAAAFRVFAPVLAALMWHLTLIGDAHLAAGRTWSQVRAGARMHALFLATEDLYRARVSDDGTRAARRRITRAEHTRRRARAVALRTVAPDQMRATVTAWLDSMRAVGEGTADTARLFTEDTTRLAHILTTPALSGLSVPDTHHLTPADLSGLDLSDPVSGLVSAAVSGSQGPVVRASVRPAVRPAVRADKPRAVRRSVRPAGPASPDKSARLAVVSALLTEHPDATTTDALAALTAAGHEVTDRTARRDLETARTTTAAPVQVADVVEVAPVTVGADR